MCYCSLKLQNTGTEHVALLSLFHLSLLVLSETYVLPCATPSVGIHISAVFTGLPFLTGPVCSWLSCSLHFCNFCSLNHCTVSPALFKLFSPAIVSIFSFPVLLLVASFPHGTRHSPESAVNHIHKWIILGRLYLQL